MSQSPPATPPGTAPRSRPGLLHQPFLYVALLALYTGVEFAGWVPRPDGGPGHGEAADGGPQRRTLEDLLRQPGETPFAAAVAVVAPLIVGTGLLIGYILLRSHNIRVFPCCQFPVVPWAWQDLVWGAVVLFLLARLVPVGVALLVRPASATPTAAALLKVLTANVTMLLACLFVVALVWEAAKTTDDRQQTTDHGTAHRFSSPRCPLSSVLCRLSSAFSLLGLSEARPFRRAVLGLVGHLMFYPLTFLAALVTMLLWQRMGLPIHPQEVLVQAVGMSPGAFGVLLVGACVVAPVTEEVLFRGFLYATLRRYVGPVGALGWSALAFALLHSHAMGFASLFLIGFLLGYLYERTGSLVASIAAHAANNVASLLVAWLTFHPAAL